MSKENPADRIIKEISAELHSNLLPEHVHIIVAVDELTGEVIMAGNVERSQLKKFLTECADAVAEKPNEDVTETRIDPTNY